MNQGLGQNISETIQRSTDEILNDVVVESKLNQTLLDDRFNLRGQLLNHPHYALIMLLHQQKILAIANAISKLNDATLSLQLESLQRGR